MSRRGRPTPETLVGLRVVRRFNSIRNSLSISISIVPPGRSRPLSSDFSVREYAKVLLRFPVLRFRKWRLLAKTRERPFFPNPFYLPLPPLDVPSPARSLFLYLSPLVSSLFASLSASFSFSFLSPALCRQHAAENLNLSTYLLSASFSYAFGYRSPSGT